MNCRVRFAPSPTGPLHIGGLRTALYNYLFAKKHGGTFILRIEDTDSQRFVPGAEAYISEALHWCGLCPDEGVTEGGPHAPYRQSERKAIYKRYADELLAKDKAYYAFDTAETLESLRKEAEAKGEAFSYNAQCRTRLQTSLALPADEVQVRIERGDPYVIRFKTPENTVVEMDDLIRGHLQVNTDTLDDKVLYKSADGLPTYHLANIVDDHLMKITHVIRGEEWLPSLPLHYLLYEAFGWQDSRPAFAHLPLLLKPQGQGKLSKRDGDKFGFPVFPLAWVDPKSGETSRGYREDGYFPEAVVNMLALLGWNPGTEQELFSLEALAEAFSLEKVSKAGARFNPEKARWFNAQYLRMRSDEELGQLILPALQARYGDTARRPGAAGADLSTTGSSLSDTTGADTTANADTTGIGLQTAARIAGLFKDRVNFPAELVDWAAVLYVRPATYAENGLKKFDKPENREALRQVLDFMQQRADTWAGAGTENGTIDAERMEAETLDFIRGKGYPMGQVMSLFRLALTGDAQGPNVFPSWRSWAWPKPRPAPKRWRDKPKRWRDKRKTDPAAGPKPRRGLAASVRKPATLCAGREVITADFGVVESQGRQVGQRKPSGRGGIVPAGHLRQRGQTDTHRIDHAHRAAARVTVGTAVRTERTERRNIVLEPQAGLFLEFAAGRPFQRLVFLHEATGQRIAVRKRRLASLDEQHITVSVRQHHFPQNIHGQGRPRISVGIGRPLASRHNEHDLTLGRIGGIMRMEVRQRVATALGINLRNLAADAGRPSGTQRIGELFQCLDQTVRRLVQHHGLVLQGQGLDTRLAAFLMRQEALEHETFARKARLHDGRNQSRGARQTLHLQSLLQTGPHEQKTRIGNARRPRVGNHSHVTALTQQPHEIGQHLMFVVLMIRLAGRFYAIMREQLRARPRVFSQNQRHRFQNFDGPIRHIGHIAHGRRHQKQLSHKCLRYVLA